MTDEPLKPLVVHLFGHCLNELSRDDCLLAMEFMRSQLSWPFEKPDPERHIRIAQHFIEMNARREV